MAFLCLNIQGSLLTRAQEDSQVLTKVVDVKQLSRDEAQRSVLVKLRGTITYLEPNGLIAFLQDETGGIYFKHRSVRLDQSLDVEQGDEVEISGVTTPGQFAPYVVGGED